MINKKIASVILILAFTITIATAEETKHHEFPSADISSLVLNMRAGTILVEHSENELISVELLIRESDRKWFSRSINMTKMDIDVTQRNSELELSFDKKGVETDWIVKIPALSRIEVNAGVGTVDIHMANAAIYASIGVGAIELELSKDLFGHIELSSGVGDTSIKGASTVNTQRAFVSSDLKARGDGALTVQAKVGVGSVEATLL